MRLGALLGLLLVLVFTLVAPTEGQGTSEGHLVISVGESLPTLDPQARGTITYTASQIFDGLVGMSNKFDSFVPSLATSWKLTQDDVWQFQLRQGVKFHNGEPFNAEAVKFTFDRVKTQPAGTYFRPVLAAEVASEYTINFRTAGPYPAILGRLAAMAIIPPRYLKEVGDSAFANRPVGTGPFRVKEFVRDNRIVLERNDQYWGTPPKVKTVEFRIIPDSTSALAGLMANQIDIVTRLDPEGAKRMRAAGHKVITVPALRFMYGFLKADKGGPLADKRVRQAINYGVDRPTIVKTIFRGQADVIATITYPGMFGHDPTVAPYPYDPERAKKLLAEAGFPDGKGLSFTLQGSQGRYPFDREALEAIGGYLQKLGINVQVEIPEWGEYLRQYFNHGHKDIAVIGQGGPQLDADASFSFFESGNVLNYWPHGQNVDTMIGRARQMLDPKGRQVLYSQLAKLVKDEAPYLFLYRIYDSYGVNTRVVNFAAPPWDYFQLSPVLSLR